MLRTVVALALLLAAPLRSAAAPAPAAAVPDRDCLQCHEDRELTRTNADGRVLSLFVDAQLLAGSRHATNACVRCHTAVTAQHPDDGRPARPVDCRICHAASSESYGASVHGRARQNGDATAADCTDCHGTHDIRPRGDAQSRLHFLRLTATCGECHPEVASEVQASVHGKATARGLRDAPLCTDCHSEHRIEDLRTASPRRVSEETCSRCHASERINAKYRLPGDRVRTFLGSYHGLAAQLGSTRAANCASCHGVHKILPSSDPASSIHRDNLVRTCGQCHPGASENFAFGRVHSDDASADGLGAAVNRWARRLYVVLILLTVAVMLAHNGFFWLRYALAARRHRGPSVLRMSLSHRLQHLTLALSFALLAASGFALKFPDSWIAWLLGADESIRRWSHRGAALVLVGVGLYHLLHLAFTREGRQLLYDLWPRRRDLADLRHNARYALGREPRRARFPRFGYVEKFEYWAVVWGTVIMGVTGFMIWFPVEVTRFLPRWVIDVATTIHYYEAILACLAILLWHFYHVIVDPEVYPLNWAFLDGRIPLEHHEKHRDPNEQTGQPPGGRRVSP